MFGDGLAFGSLDLFELIDLGAFAVLSAADAVGKEGLKPRIGRRNRGILNVSSGKNN
jgi:hypothetical protein